MAELDPNFPEDHNIGLQNSCPIQRSHRHATIGVSYRQPNVTTRQRSSTVAPMLPPKQNRQTVKQNIFKTQSLDHTNLEVTERRKRENAYISTEEIQSFPRSRQQSTSATGASNRPFPNIKNVGPRERLRVSISNNPQDLQSSVRKPPLSPTRFPANDQGDLYTTTFKTNSSSPVPPAAATNSQSTVTSLLEFDNFLWKNNENRYNPTDQEISQLHQTRLSTTPSNASTAVFESPPVPEISKPQNSFVDDLSRIQRRLFKLYRRVQQSPQESTLLADLKTYLRLPDHESIDNVLEGVHMHLMLPQESDEVERKIMYIVDFRSFRDKHDLRHRIVEMFAKPGPPSMSYAKVDAKMDNIISEFCTRVANLRESQNAMVESPAHARMVLQGVSDGEQLVKALRDNQLWIRWGTSSNLPPLYHLYMHKQPPSYEVRKAVTISFIAERLRTLPDMRSTIIDSNLLCPPIYSRLKTDSTKTKWQVTEYNDTSGTYETHECQFPSWLDDDSTAFSFLNSSNRSTFEFGSHPYELYSVYVVIIKDFTLGNENGSRNGEKDWATPSKVQYYIGSSSTGVLYKFAHVKNSHCDRIRKVLSDALTLRHFRCYDGCDLVEACLALSWARRQPRAVFVINSFLPRTMSNLTLSQKEPFKEKMLSLVHHLTEGKKIGPLCNMRYGMNGTTTITSDEE